MSAQPYDLILSAEVVVDPATFEPRKNAMVCIRGDRVIAITDNAPALHARRRIDCGDAVLLPAFVNAHTHLDLSHNRGLDLTSASFDQWLVKVVQSRCAPRDMIVAALRLTLEEMLATGTARAIDILAATDYAADIATVIAQSPLAATLCVETFELDPQGAATAHARSADIARRVLAALLGATGENPDAYLARMATDRRSPSVGHSPHAPYSTSGKLYELCALLAAQERAPIATHLAESPEERRFLADGSGQFREVFTKLGMDLSTYRPPGLSPLAFWKQHVAPHTQAGVNDTLFVHCYDMQDHEITEMGRMRAVVAYCPRSRAYFGHPPFRFARFVESGCVVAIGTDSLASNEDLNLYHELRQARLEQPQVPARELFRAATMGGRRAIAGARASQAELAGWADWQVVKAPGITTMSCFDTLLKSDPHVCSLIIDGRIVFET